MSDLLIERIKDFVSKQASVKKGKLSRDTRLEHDLGITGDESDDFIERFSLEFHVDVSEFEIGKYFMDEGMRVLPFLVGVMFGRGRSKSKPITLADLEKAAEIGKLV